MVTKSGGDRLAKAMAELVKKVGEDRVVKVGYFEDAEYPDGTKVALVAAVQNFGSPKNNIPPRPFFTTMVEAGRRIWPDQAATIYRQTRGDVRRTLELMGAEMVGQLRESIQNTNSPPLKPGTIRRKGHAKPLVDSGRMWNAPGPSFKLGKE